MKPKSQVSAFLFAKIQCIRVFELSESSSIYWLSPELCRPQVSLLTQLN